MPRLFEILLLCSAVTCVALSNNFKECEWEDYTETTTGCPSNCPDENTCVQHSWEKPSCSFNVFANCTISNGNVGALRTTRLCVQQYANCYCTGDVLTQEAVTIVRQVCNP